MRAVRYAGRDGAARLGRLEDDVIVDAGPAPGIGFDASPEAWEIVAGASGYTGGSMTRTCSQLVRHHPNEIAERLEP